MKTSDVIVGDVYQLSDKYGFKDAYGFTPAYGRILDGPLPFEKPGKFVFEIEVLTGRYVDQQLTLTAVSIHHRAESERASVMQSIDRLRRDDRTRVVHSKIKKAFTELGIRATSRAHRGSTRLHLDDINSAELLRHLTVAVAAKDNDAAESGSSKLEEMLDLS